MRRLSSIACLVVCSVLSSEGQSPLPANFCQGLQHVISSAGTNFASLASSRYDMPGLSGCNVENHYSLGGALTESVFDCPVTQDIDQVNAVIESCLGGEWKREQAYKRKGAYYKISHVTVSMAEGSFGGASFRVAHETEEGTTVQQKISQQADADTAQEVAKDAIEDAAQQSLDSTISVLNGKWICKGDSSTTLVSGRSYLSDGSATAARVLATTNTELHLEVNSILADDKSAAGIITLIDSEHLATKWEADGYAGQDKIIVSQYPPACFNTQHNECVTSFSQNVDYIVDSTTEVNSASVTFKTTHPSCSGSCPDHLESGKTFTLRRGKDEDFVTYKGIKCRKYN